MLFSTEQLASRLSAESAAAIPVRLIVESERLWAKRTTFLPSPAQRHNGTTAQRHKACHILLAKEPAAANSLACLADKRKAEG